MDVSHLWEVGEGQVVVSVMVGVQVSGNNSNNHLSLLHLPETDWALSH